MMEFGIKHKFDRKDISEYKGKGCQEIHCLYEGCGVGGGGSVKRQALDNE